MRRAHGGSAEEAPGRSSRSRPARRRALATFVALAVLACSSPLGLEPTGGPFDPPASFRAADAEVRSCLAERFGLEIGRPFRAVTWVEGEITWDGEDRQGSWRPATREIWLESGPEASIYLVTHELIHELLRVRGHDHPAFGDPRTFGVDLDNPDDCHYLRSELPGG